MDKAEQNALDERIAELLLRGDTGVAIEGFQRAYGPLFRGMLRRKLNADARCSLDEVYGDFIEKVIGSAPTFKGTALVRTWAATIAKRTAAAANANRKVWRETPLDSVIPAPPCSTRYPYTAAGGVVAPIVAKLPEPDKSIYGGRSEGVSFAELAEKLSMSEAGVRKRFERIRARLKREVADRRPKDWPV